MELRLDRHRQQAVLQAVVPEDGSERRADHSPEAEIGQGPRRVLARRPAAEVVPRHQDAGGRRFRAVQHEIGAGRAVLRVAPVGEQVPPEPGLSGDFQEARRDDDVRVDVVDRQDDVARCDGADRFHAHFPIISRASAMVPATALAAAVSGLARKVRPPAPCRPSKLRLLVLTAYCPGRSWSPLPARLAEYAVEPLRLRLSLHLLRAGHDEQPYVGGDLPAAQQRRRQTQVAEAGVGARADEHHVDRMPQEPLPGTEVHVAERPLHRRLPAGRRDGAAHGHRHPRVGAIGDHRLERRGVDVDHTIVRRPFVGRQTSPGRERPLPGLALWRVRPARQVLERRVVRGDHPGARPRLDRHVADRHPLVHRQRSDGRPGVLDDVAGSAAHADFRDDAEDEVLGRHPGVEPSLDPDLQRPRSGLQQALRHQDVRHFRGADPERQRPEGPVCRRVAVAADDRHPRLRQSQLRPDDVHDPLPLAPQGVQPDAVVPAVRLELRDLRRRFLVRDREPPVRPAWRRRRRVIHRRDRALRPADCAAAPAQRRERLG